MVVFLELFVYGEKFFVHLFNKSTVIINNVRFSELLTRYLGWPQNEKIEDGIGGNMR